jgi:hypothetical protein
LEAFVQIVYYAHSYREDDARVTQFFLALLSGHGLRPSLDPPSDVLNSAKLERHLRASDGLVAVLTQRQDGTYSRYIYYEIMLALRARKPAIVFVEDSLPNDLLPTWVVQRRFSRRLYGRQVRDLGNAITEFRAYLGTDPPARYGALTTRRSCVVAGFDAESSAANIVEMVLASRGYEVSPDTARSNPSWGEPRSFEALADSDLAVCNVDATGLDSHYAMGALHSAFVPTINVSRVAHESGWVPGEFLPCDMRAAGLRELLLVQVDIFEQDFLEVGDASRADDYIGGLIEADARRTRVGSFGHSGGFFMGDQINVTGSQVGGIGDGNIIANNEFRQRWEQSANDIDLAALAIELRQLRSALQSSATTADEAAALGEAAQAEIAASKGDGPLVMQRLKSAGRWLWEKAEELAMPLAAAALRQALGL